MLLLCFEIEINYQKYLQENKESLSLIEAKDNLSINYMNGKVIHMNETKKDINFSIINNSSDKAYYNISLSNITGDTSNSSYVITSHGDYYYEDDFSQTILGNHLEIDPGSTVRYTLTIVNDDKKDFSFTINIEPVNIENTLGNVLLKNNPIKTSAISNLFMPATDNEGLISLTSTKGTSYYFRGNILNNYVQFGDSVWRIVKINEDSSVELILDNVLENTTSYNTNESANNTVFTNSNVYQTLLTWYSNHLKTNDAFIADSVYCYDDSVTDNSNLIDGTSLYAPDTRLFTNHTPTNECKGSSISSKIGLLTADEAVYAGASLNSNTTYYLHLNSNISSWWTMTPSKTKNNSLYLMSISNDGIVNDEELESNSIYVRPVITVTNHVLATGDGTSDHPYILSLGN